MKIFKNILKIDFNIPKVFQKKVWVGPKILGSVGLPETRHFLLLALNDTDGIPERAFLKKV